MFPARSMRAQLPRKHENAILWARSSAASAASFAAIGEGDSTHKNCRSRIRMPSPYVGATHLVRIPKRRGTWAVESLVYCVVEEWCLPLFLAAVVVDFPRSSRSLQLDGVQPFASPRSLARAQRLRPFSPEQLSAVHACLPSVGEIRHRRVVKAGKGTGHNQAK
jgi:hypothetical protein